LFLRIFPEASSRPYRKAAWKRVANAKELAKVHNREAGEAGKVAKKAQKDSLTAANIAHRKHTQEA